MRQRIGIERGAGAGRQQGLRWAGRLTGVAAAVLVGLGVAPGVAAAAPYNPTDGQLSAAEQTADAAAAEVGRLSAQLATSQAEVDAANAAANIALDAYQGKQAEYEDARAAAKKADAAEKKAQAQLDEARTAVAGFARDSYMSGSTSSRMQGLLTSGSPAQMLERAALLDAAGDHRSDVLGRVTVAQHRAAAAASAAQTALATAATLKKQAAAALAAAEQVEAGARQKATAFQAQQSRMQAQLDQAQQTLRTLRGERAAATTYQRSQAAAAAAAAASAASSAGLAAQPAPSRGSAAPAPSAPPAPSAHTAGAGNSSAVETAIAAARRWIGTRYAWGGGSLSGPSLGFGIDAGVVGFDCSGLTRYAYAQAGISIPRNSSAQYANLPKVSGANLQRGDLLFWATNTSNPATIHHVAIYLGGGQMIEAPESGKTVRVTAMRWTGFIGGARPTA